MPGADELSGGDHDLIVAVDEHIDRHLGSGGFVIHELLSPAVHVDLIPSPATDERPFTVVTTCGMAELPMRTPDDDEVSDLTHAELFVLLPPDWPLDEALMQDERHWWPLRLLKTLARFPHEFDAWLWTGHTVPNEDPPEPYAEGTGLCGALIMPPMLVPDGFGVLERPDAAPIHFLMVVRVPLPQGAVAAPGARRQRRSGATRSRLIDVDTAMRGQRRSRRRGRRLIDVDVSPRARRAAARAPRRPRPRTR